MSELENVAGAGLAAPSAKDGKLHRRLSSVGVLLLTLSCLSPVLSIYGVGADVLAHAGSGAVLLFLIGIGGAVVWGVVYAELGSAYPYAGGDYIAVGNVLGGWAGALTLAMWAITSGPSCAFEAWVIAQYAAELVPGVPAAAVAFGALALAVAVALLTVRASTLVTSLFLAVEMACVLGLLGVGLMHPARSLGQAILHPVALNPAGGLGPIALMAMAPAAINAVYATLGGNQAIYFGEELGDPHKRMGRVVLAACLIGAFATAVPVITSVLAAPDLKAFLTAKAPFAALMTAAVGPWAGVALSVGVILATFNALIVQIMANARLFFSLGRDGLFPGPVNRLLTGVSAHSGSPRKATLVVAVFAAVCGLLPSHVLLVFMSGLLVYAWAPVCLTLLVGRAKGLTGAPGYWRAPLHPLAPIIGLVMAVVFAVTDLADKDAGRPGLIALGLVGLAAVVWHELVLKKRGWKPSLGG